ncbi:MAG TPA: OFA family MFS transporter [Phycisphaerae bacterium]|nr:OFA family MFS transporter [Phycisphaerae bacterium]HRW55162.1 OFA family MFS transporter [Phycisphaerae bacterium]
MRADSRLMNRWCAVVGAVLIQLCLGAIYAWSVFTPALEAAGWTKTRTQCVFAAGLFFFAVSMVFAGKMLPKRGPRLLAVMGGIVLGAGYIIAGLFGGADFWATFIGVGVIGGVGIGLAYVVPIAVGMRWFPDRKGLITGFAVAGFGFGALLWVKLAGAWGHMIANYGLGQTFITYGAFFLIAVPVGAVWMIFPPEGWRPAGFTPPAANAAAGDGSVEFTSRELLRSVEFYKIFLTFLFGASAGLMCIGLMKSFPMSALKANGVSDANASAIAGTAMAVFFSLANGVGRIAWGAISDHLGRRNSLVLMTATQGIVVILFQWMAGAPALLYLAATLIGFNFGGNFALFPNITADTFGVKSVGQNYPWVFLAYGVGGILGPIMGGRLGDLQNFSLAFYLCGGLCIAAALIIASVHPARKTAQRGFPVVGVDEGPAPART